MKKYNMKNSIALLISFLFLHGCKNKEEITVASRVETLPYYSEATFTPHWFSVDSDSLLNFHKIADFSLIDQEGDAVSNQTFTDKIYITDFFFTTCPGICKKMTISMKYLPKAITRLN